MMIASLMFYKKTGEQKYLVKFEEARHYCINHFCDDRFGEWYGYLRRIYRSVKDVIKGELKLRVILKAWIDFRKGITGKVEKYTI